MSIVNIWSKLDLIQSLLVWNTTLNTLFSWWIFAGKPLDVWDDLSLYFWLSNNTPLIETDRKWQKNLKKRALFEFVITTNKKDTPEVEIYEALDILSNEIVWLEIDLSWFTINWIQEWNQSWVLMDVNQNPLLVSQYFIDYTSLY
jgi:uncharacterized protein with NRDE domain